MSLSLSLLLRPRTLTRWSWSVAVSGIPFNNKVSRRPYHHSSLPEKVDYEFTNELDIERPEGLPTRKAFQILGDEGVLIPGAKEPNVSKEFVQKAYRGMVTLQVMDHVLYEAQRQGRISFYMQANGEEGATIGSAAALKDEDTVFAQYRESGVLVWRGFTLQQFCDQCFSNVDDLGKGRQMPIHYGSKKLNYHTISSPLTTQLPQAVGAAYALKKDGPEGPVVAVYFGEGAASEGDFHAAMNFASTLECPVMFICRNNQYAISTPVQDQYRGDGIVSRAAGYGMASLRVDGNDFFAVHNAVAEARAYARNQCKPILVELMTYRIGHHSTSDDSTAYRTIEEIETWKTTHHPIPRLKKFMEDRKWWTEEEDKEFRDQTRVGVLKAMMKAEEKEKPEALDNLFDDVYKTLTPNLKEQKQELEALIQKYPKHYTTEY